MAAMFARVRRAPPVSSRTPRSASPTWTPPRPATGAVGTGAAASAGAELGHSFARVSVRAPASAQTPIQCGKRYRKGSYGHWRKKYKGNKKYQVDHFPPVAAYKGTKYEKLANYYRRPAFPLRTKLHQFTKGRGGFGGHASTTGRTYVSKGFTGRLNQLMKQGNFYEAMKLDLIDKQNLALIAHGDRHSYDRRLHRGVKLALKNKWITPSQYFDLRFNHLDF